VLFHGLLVFLKFIVHFRGATLHSVKDSEPDGVEDVADAGDDVPENTRDKSMITQINLQNDKNHLEWPDRVNKLNKTGFISFGTLIFLSLSFNPIIKSFQSSLLNRHSNIVLFNRHFFENPSYFL